MNKLMITTALAFTLSVNVMAVNPSELLPAGQDASVDSGKHGERLIRKGTILAFIRTLEFLNRSLMASEISQEVGQATQDLKNTIIDQDTLGTFKFFPVTQWLENPNKPANILAGVYYLQLNPEELTPSIKEQLENLASLDLNSLVKTEIVKLKI